MLNKKHKEWYDSIYRKMHREMLEGNTPKYKQQLLC